MIRTVYTLMAILCLCVWLVVVVGVFATGFSEAGERGQDVLIWWLAFMVCKREACDDKGNTP